MDFSGNGGNVNCAQNRGHHGERYWLAIVEHVSTKEQVRSEGKIVLLRHRDNALSVQYALENVHEERPAHVRKSRGQNSIMDTHPFMDKILKG